MKILDGDIFIRNNREYGWKNAVEIISKGSRVFIVKNSPFTVSFTLCSSPKKIWKDVPKDIFYSCFDILKLVGEELNEDTLS